MTDAEEVERSVGRGRVRFYWMIMDADVGPGSIVVSASASYRCEGAEDRGFKSLSGLHTPSLESPWVSRPYSFSGAKSP